MEKLINLLLLFLLVYLPPIPKQPKMFFKKFETHQASNTGTDHTTNGSPISPTPPRLRELSKSLLTASLSLSLYRSSLAVSLSPPQWSPPSPSNYCTGFFFRRFPDTLPLSKKVAGRHVFSALFSFAKFMQKSWLLRLSLSHTSGKGYWSSV